jgi:hypothetical protein
MTPELDHSSHTQHATPAATKPQPEQVLAWLATQATPDHGESAPPLPADLLNDIQKTFGIAPEAAARTMESSSLWSRITEAFSARGMMAWGGALTTACIVALLVWQNGQPSDGSGTTGVGEPMRGGGQATSMTGISWQWTGLENFPAEQAKLEQAELISAKTSTGIVVHLDATSDPLKVILTITKDGVAQPDPAPVLYKNALGDRPSQWVNALQQLQSKLQTPP